MRTKANISRVSYPPQETHYQPKKAILKLFLLPKWRAVFVWMLCWHLNGLLLISGICGTQNTLLFTSQFRGISSQFASRNVVFFCIFEFHHFGWDPPQERSLVQLLPPKGKEPWVSLENQTGCSQLGFRDRAQQQLFLLPASPSKPLLASAHSLFPNFWGKNCPILTIPQFGQPCLCWELDFCSVGGCGGVETLSIPSSAVPCV